MQANTRHIISTKEFEKMKKGVVIVNTARGAVIDEDALVKALDSGLVWSVGLDVYEEEPKIHHVLIANSHVMLLPHMETWTIEVSKKPRGLSWFVADRRPQTGIKMEEWNIGNVRAVLEKGKLNSIVPEQADMA